MIKNFPPNYDPNLFSMVAAVAGAVLVGDFDDYELNSIGNWIILLGQYMLTFAAQQQLIEQRIEGHNININSKQTKQGGSMEDSKLNKVEITRNGAVTNIKINNQPIHFVGKYSITHDIEKENGIPMLEIRMAIDEKASTITI